METVTLAKSSGLKRGKKKEMAKGLSEAIRNGLVEWRDGDLVDDIYPGTTTISGGTLLGDDVVQQLVSSGIRIETKEQLRQHTRWYLGFHGDTTDLTSHGRKLLELLHSIYTEYDRVEEEENARLASLPQVRSEVTPENFYGGATNRTSARREGGDRGVQRARVSRRARGRVRRGTT